VLLSLFHCGRHFVGLAIAPADPAATVSDDHQGRETETTTALDDRRTTLDLDRAVDKVTA
jgi:hypothetical protein